jgi:hypothetical protein
MPLQLLKDCFVSKLTLKKIGKKLAVVDDNDNPVCLLSEEEAKRLDLYKSA